MMRLKQLGISFATAMALVLVIFVVPSALIAVVGWPLPTTLPDPARLATAIEQRDLAADVVIKGLAVVVWLLWVQLMWALMWELVVNGRRLARGLRSRPAPLVAAPLNALAVRMVSGMLAASMVAASATTALSLPATPSLAITGVTAADANPQVSFKADHPTVARLASSPPPSTPALDPPGTSGKGPRWLVKEGDSLWSIAEATLGDGERSAEVLNLNPGLDTARSVRPGMVLRLPLGTPVPHDRSPTVDPSDGEPQIGQLPEAEIEVAAGDSLWTLSEQRLTEVVDNPAASAVVDHVAEVVKANAELIDDPDLIHPGQVFTFPSIGQGSRPHFGPGSAVQEERVQEERVQEERVQEEREVQPEKASPQQGDQGSDPPGETPIAETPVPEAPAEGPPHEQVDVGDGEDGIGLSPLGFGLAGAFLAAGALDLARRRWRYRMSHRSAGTMPRALDRERSSTDRALRREADEDARRWLHGAIGTLTLRPVWEGEKLAQPSLVTLDSSTMDVEFDAPDPMAAPVPWMTDDDGRHWRLDRSTPLDEIGPLPTATPLPTLVTVGDGLLINLEAFGVLGIEGSGNHPTALVRSIVHELATSPAAGAIDIRCTIPIVGVESYELVRNQSPTELEIELPSWLDDIDAAVARTSSSNAYGHRLVTDLDPIGPVVVVSDQTGLRSMPKLIEYAARCVLPVVVIVIGPTGSTGLDRRITIGPKTARLEPAGVDFAPQLLSARAARELGQLLKEVGRHDEEPLVPPVELSASVTDIRRGNLERPTIKPPVCPAPLRVVKSPSFAEIATRVSDVDVPSPFEEPPQDQPDVGRAPASQDPLPAPESERERKREPEPTLETEPGSEQTAGGGRADGDLDVEPIMIHVLGDVRAVGASEELTSQQLSLVSYLACNGSTSREALIEALWDGQVISKSRFPNLLAETRARIGRHHFPEARDGRYELRSVTTDLAQFERHVLKAKRLDGAAAVAASRQAVELIEGVPFTPPSRRFWSWVGDHSHVAARVESMVADTAARLARVEQDQGNPEGARWACEQGLLASPTDETLVVVLTEIYMELGRPGLARRLVDTWEDRIGRLDCGEPSDEPRKRLAG